MRSVLRRVIMGHFLQSREQRRGRRERQGHRRGTQGQHLDHRHQVSPYTPCFYLIMGGGNEIQAHNQIDSKI